MEKPRRAFSVIQKTRIPRNGRCTKILFYSALVRAAPIRGGIALRNKKKGRGGGEGGGEKEKEPGTAPGREEGSKVSVPVSPIKSGKM